MSRESVAGRSRCWVWEFDAPVSTVWPVMADTARFNEAADLPKHLIDERTQPDGSVRYFATARRGPLRIDWEEQPVNWIHERWFEHVRIFTSGPLQWLRAELRLLPTAAGSRCEYTVNTEGRGWAGRILVSTVFFHVVERRFSALARCARAYTAGDAEQEFGVAPPSLPGSVRARVDALVEQIDATPYGHGLASRIADYVLNRQEVDLMSIRPMSLARRWQVPERHAIEACLESVRHGLLAMRWDLLCPRCQISKASVVALDQLPTGAHCDTCNIDYEREFADNVELSFHPSETVRPVAAGEYCLFGPMSTPHIKIQLTLEPGASRVIEVDLQHGSYRARTLAPGPEHSFEWNEGHFPGIALTDDAVVLEPPSGADRLGLSNRSRKRQTLIVEERIWRRDALTVKRAAALQAFRDLFSRDVLRPGDNIGIDFITIMFTDLKGSTALYERIGDPAAYALVREHFAILGMSIRGHEGAVVKTIGDAVMAVFLSPSRALACAIDIHAAFERFNEGSGRAPAVVKLGLHCGRCIAVTLNDRLDYYGTAANLAARLQGRSTGGDIVLSEAMAGDPGVEEMLAALSPRLEHAALKGYAEPVPFYRIGEAALAAHRVSGTDPI